MVYRNQKGFTLIELLVVVAIIGILATLGTVSLSGARAKARDAKRLSDVKQLSTGMEVLAALDEIKNITCATESTLSCTNLGTTVLWNNFVDPSNIATPCKTGVTGTCQYGLKPGSTTDNYEICFKMESKSNIGDPAILKKMVTGGSITDTCTF